MSGVSPSPDPGTMYDCPPSRLSAPAGPEMLGMYDTPRSSRPVSAVTEGWYDQPRPATETYDVPKVETINIKPVTNLHFPICN